MSITEELIPHKVLLWYLKVELHWVKNLDGEEHLKYTGLI